MRTTNAAVLYAKIRTGKAFFIGLSIFCAAWITWNLIPGLPHFDDGGFGKLTLILSVEASIATSMLMAATEKQDEAQQKQQKYMLDLMEMQVAQTKYMSSTMNEVVTKLSS